MAQRATAIIRRVAYQHMFGVAQQPVKPINQDYQNTSEISLSPESATESTNLWQVMELIYRFIDSTRFEATLT